MNERQIDLLQTTQWIGNPNLWFDAAPDQRVEVHRAMDLRVAKGRAAGPGVFLPPRDLDGFDIDVVYNGAGWSAEVVGLRDWYWVLLVKAPDACARSVVSLLVKRRSDEYVVPVDFSFESVEGRGDMLGCVTV